MTRRRGYTSPIARDPRMALTKAEHDLLVDLLGRPVTQAPIKRRTVTDIPHGFVPAEPPGATRKTNAQRQAAWRKRREGK